MAETDTKTKVLTLLADIGETLDDARDMSPFDRIQFAIDMAEQAITLLADNTEYATNDGDVEAIKTSFNAVGKMIQELQDITEA